MILVVCATELELQPFLRKMKVETPGWKSMVCGVGAVETAINLTRTLEKQNSTGQVDVVINFGIGGAYCTGESDCAELLDICVASVEIFGDFGICMDDGYQALGEHLVRSSAFSLQNKLTEQCKAILQFHNIPFRQGVFVTVAAASGTAARGAILANQYGALCENMEGAAVARVCADYAIPVFEIRAISNYVEDRDVTGWNITGASEKAGEVAAITVEELLKKK